MIFKQTKQLYSLGLFLLWSTMFLIILLYLAICMFNYTTLDHQLVPFQDKYKLVLEKNDKLEEQMASLSSSFLSLKVGCPLWVLLLIVPETHALFQIT
jgi:ATP/ADP translocase